MTTGLTLKGKVPLKRGLDLRLGVTGHLSASLFSDCERPKMLAFSVVTLTDCYLFLGKYCTSALWMEHASFDVSEAEAQQIRATYEPLGLRVETEGAMAEAVLRSTDAAVHP